MTIPVAFPRFASEHPAPKNFSDLSAEERAAASRQNWDEDCGLFVARFGAETTPGFRPSVYGPTAWDVRLRSTIVSTDWTKAPALAIHFFRQKVASGTPGHTGIQAEPAGGRFVSATTAAAGTQLAPNLRAMTVAEYIAKKGGLVEYAGWSYDYAGARLAGTILAGLDERPLDNNNSSTSGRKRHMDTDRFRIDNPAGDPLIGHDFFVNSAGGTVAHSASPQQTQNLVYRHFGGIADPAMVPPVVISIPDFNAMLWEKGFPSDWSAQSIPAGYIFRTFDHPLSTAQLGSIAPLVSAPALPAGYDYDKAAQAIVAKLPAFPTHIEGTLS